MSDTNGSAPAGNPAPAAGAATPPATPPAAPPGAAPAPWFGEFKDPTLKGWVQNKNFESAESLASSYLNLEKLFGHDKAGRTVVMPGKDAQPAEVDAFYNKLGRPPTAAEYNFPKEGVDEKIIAAARDTFHKVGLTSAQAQTLSDWWMGVEKGIGDARTQAITARNTQETEALRKEWGAAFDDRSKLVDRAVQQFGIEEADLSGLRDAWGPAKAMKFFAALGEGMGEGSFVSGDNRAKGFAGAMTPDQAKAKIADLRNDAGFVRRYQSGDVEAKAEMERLHKWGYPDE